MNSMVFRLGVVIAIVAMVQGGFYFVGKLAEAPEVVQPRQPLSTFPQTVEVTSSKWQGVDEKLDPRTLRWLLRR